MYRSQMLLLRSCAVHTCIVVIVRREVSREFSVGLVLIAGATRLLLRLLSLLLLHMHKVKLLLLGTCGRSPHCGCDGALNRDSSSSSLIQSSWRDCSGPVEFHRCKQIL